MSKLFKQSMFVVGTTLLPVFAFAQQDVGGVFIKIGAILNIIVPIVMTLALLYFFWGLATYILGAGDEEKRKTGRGIMIWGVVALFVMASVWGLTRLLGNTFLPGTNLNAPNVEPLIPTR